MKIFLSWSGNLSREVALLLSEHLRPILWDVKTFMSGENIPSGSEWTKVLARELKENPFAIVCLTPQNLSSPWLLYEAGALTYNDDNKLCALLLGTLTLEDVRGPLERYQHRALTEKEFRTLLDDIRKMLADPPTEKEFDQNFAMHWPAIQKGYAEALKKFPETRLPRPETTFERHVLTLPLSKTLLDELIPCIENARMKCLEKIRTFSDQSGISSDCVRANVFVPEYGGVRHGYAFELVMHDRLRREMDRSQEWGVRLAPGFGATGTVFLECQQRIVQRRDFELTEGLRDLIHPELKWIISSPVKGSSGEALAVLNIDGLKYELDREKVLQPMGELISAELKSIEQVLDAYPKTVVTIQYGASQ